MISAIYWIRKGVAVEIPEKYELDDKEYDRINQLAAIQLEEPEEKLEKDQNPKMSDDSEFDPELSKYNLNQYDDDDEDNGQSISLFGNMKGLAYYTSNEEDPYITLNDEDDEQEDVRILPTDNILVAAKTEDEVSQLEIYVYEEAEDNLYVHHDIMLPSFPLCLEWLDFRLGRKVGTPGSGNYIAVGTFDPEIEIWDLDTLDSMYPDAILGKQEEKQKKKKKSKKPNTEFHTDSVMSLSWNKNHRNLLASSSADTTVKLWDLQSLKCAHSFNHHKDKVQRVEWHPIESTILLTASFDKSVAAFDSRSPTNVAFWNIGDADPECIKWDPFSPQYFYVSIETGLVLYFDARNFGKGTPVFTLHAHDSAVSSLDVSSSIQGCIVTGSTDKLVKIWDVKDMKPNMVTSRDLGVGKVFTAQFCPDSPFQLAVAGSEGKVFIWDLSSNAGIRNSFKGRSNVPFSSESTITDVSIT
ncbi:WD40-repeat-containing domain protein [Glomus cerebriforme]|uniref:WD40-repeat-containing domain protein n=1 Tax=Glomus cerebriforme TaxID=658196 RepID=A0A397TK97_9GLOM|nr:WD40-repeat-containing domain protein [Glomus cerebriforme]